MLTGLVPRVPQVVLVEGLAVSPEAPAMHDAAPRGDHDVGPAVPDERRWELVVRTVEAGAARGDDAHVPIDDAEASRSRYSR